MTPRILVLGGEGMLGHKMFQRLRERFPGTLCSVRGSVRDDPLRRIDLFRVPAIVERLDVMQDDNLRRVLKELQPEVVINCVGVIKQRPEARDAIPSIAINALLPHRLAEAVRPWKGRLIHFSTDCVFSGRRGGYTEDDQPDAEDLYGRTKFLGEVTTSNALTLRTSMIGRELFEHRSLLDWFLQQRGGSVRGFTRVRYSGVTTNHLTGLVSDIVEGYPRLSGLYQVASETITKYELLCLLREAYRLDVDIVPEDNEVCDRSLRGDRFNAATGYVCPPWGELVRQLADDPTPYDDWVALT
jgi:dTDP-4-dehydrorhamnose reductase